MRTQPLSVRCPSLCEPTSTARSAREIIEPPCGRPKLFFTPCWRETLEGWEGACLGWHAQKRVPNRPVRHTLRVVELCGYAHFLRETNHASCVATVNRGVEEWGALDSVSIQNNHQNTGDLRTCARSFSLPRKMLISFCWLNDVCVFVKLKCRLHQ